jgi:hypothetical protein
VPTQQGLFQSEKRPDHLSNGFEQFDAPLETVA